jgi:hypothetical protein
VADPRPGSVVFAPSVLFTWMRRQIDTYIPQVVEPDGDRAPALIEGQVHVHAQARDPRLLDGIGGAR